MIFSCGFGGTWVENLDLAFEKVGVCRRKLEACCLPFQACVFVRFALFGSMGITYFRIRNLKL